jgi:hypothetical protein
MRSLTRRYFLKVLGLIGASVAGILATTGRVAGADDGLDDRTLKTLSLLARDIFPHPKIASTVYDRAAKRIASETAASVNTLTLVREGLLDLNERATGGDWSALDEAARARVLTALTETPFFAYMRNTAGEVVYRDPAVWNLIGYGGSAIEHGGYLTRGFDNIAWLPTE